MAYSRTDSPFEKESATRNLSPQPAHWEDDMADEQDYKKKDYQSDNESERLNRKEESSVNEVEMDREHNADLESRGEKSRDDEDRIRRRDPRRDYDDRTATSLLIRHLKFTTPPAVVRRYFESIGPVKDVYLPLEYDTGRPRGFGFVEFRNPSDAREALIRLNDKELDGAVISISIAQHGRKTPSIMRARTGYRRGYRYSRFGPYDRYDRSPVKRRFGDSRRNIDRGYDCVGYRDNRDYRDYRDGRDYRGGRDYREDSREYREGPKDYRDDSREYRHRDNIRDSPRDDSHERVRDSHRDYSRNENFDEKRF